MTWKLNHSQSAGHFFIAASLGNHPFQAIYNCIKFLHLHFSAPPCCSLPHWSVKFESSIEAQAALLEMVDAAFQLRWSMLLAERKGKIKLWPWQRLKCTLYHTVLDYACAGQAAKTILYPLLVISLISPPGKTSHAEKNPQ